jgi:hypothetical protein
VVAGAVGALFAIATALHPLRKMYQRLFRIEDQLDTTSPGGLTDVVNALKTSAMRAGSGTADGTDSETDDAGDSS